MDWRSKGWRASRAPRRVHLCYGLRFGRVLVGELTSLELLGAAWRDRRSGWLTACSQFWLTQMLADFIGVVNAYREARRLGVQAKTPLA